MANLPPTDPNELLRSIAEAGKGVRFGRGVVGKTSHAMIVLLGIWGVIAWRIGPQIVPDILMIIVGLIASTAFYWWAKVSQAFAERNPAQAMLDGAEFIEYKRIETASKGGILLQGPSAAEEALDHAPDGVS